MRLPRFFAKKRGDRRTGGEVWGSVGDALFHSILLAAGILFAALLLSGVAVPEWRINHHFLAARGTVVGKGLARRAAAGQSPVTWQPCLRLRYPTAAGLQQAWAPCGPVETDRAAAAEPLGDTRLGAELDCWYDPESVDVVVLERGYNWWMWALTLLLPGALVAFGGAGVARAAVAWGKSEERQAALAVRHPARAGAAGPGPWPGVPPGEDLENSPGTILAFRLPIESGESWALLGFGLFALLWNAVLVVLAVNAGLDLLGGRIDWLLLSILVPFLVVGIAGIVVFIRSLILATAVGTTQIEISDHPLLPGRRYEVLLGQGGSGVFTSLELAIELEEQATFRQGTDTRTERAVVWRAELGSWRGLQLAPGTRFEGRADVQIPAAAMHSFASEHNGVTWRLVVRGRPARWPAFTRSFPVLIYPPAPPSESDGETCR
ncbi:MAG: hypothetical protein RLZZ440_1569 [Planctomycetota bacterium]